VIYDTKLGYIHWDVSLARAAGELVERDLRRYLTGELVPNPQSAGTGSYRKTSKADVTLSSKRSAERTDWLCDRLGESG